MDITERLNLFLEGMTKNQYEDMLRNTQKVAQKAKRDYDKLVLIIKNQPLINTKEIQQLVKKIQKITYGTIFDYPLRDGGFGEYLVKAKKSGMSADKEIEDMRKRIENFEKWRKSNPSQSDLF